MSIQVVDRTDPVTKYTRDLTNEEWEQIEQSMHPEEVSRSVVLNKIENEIYDIKNEMYNYMNQVNKSNKLMQLKCLLLFIVGMMVGYLLAFSHV